MDPTLPAKYPRNAAYEPADLMDKSDIPLEERITIELRKIADALNDKLAAYGMIYEVTPPAPGSFTSNSTPQVIPFDAAFPSGDTPSGVQRDLTNNRLVADKVRGIFIAKWDLSVEVATAVTYTIEVYVDGVATGVKEILTLTGAATTANISGGGQTQLVEGGYVDIRVSSPGPSDQFDIISGTLTLTRIA